MSAYEKKGWLALSLILVPFFHHDCLSLVIYSVEELLLDTWGLTTGQAAMEELCWQSLKPTLSLASLVLTTREAPTGPASHQTCFLAGYGDLPTSSAMLSTTA